MSMQRLFHSLEGIVLDAVGTLIEPWPIVADAYAEAARRQGIALDRATVKGRFGRAFREAEGIGGDGEVLATDEGREYQRWRRIVGDVLAEVPDGQRAFRELWDHFGRPESWRCFPDVGPALRELDAAGVPIVIASNFDARLRGIVRGLPELVPWAEGVVVCSEVGYRKPHPEFYKAACRRIGLPPERVLFVGDDPDQDVGGPERARSRGVLVGRRPGGPTDLPRVADLMELVRYIPNRS